MRIELKSNILITGWTASPTHPGGAKISIHRVKQRKMALFFSMASYVFVNRISDEEWLEEWCKRLEDIAQWPFQYDWIPNTSFLVVSFCEDRNGTKFRSEDFVNNLRGTEYNKLKVNDGKPFSEFKMEEEVDKSSCPDYLDNPWAEVHQRRGVNSSSAASVVHRNTPKKKKKTSKKSLHTTKDAVPRM